jgi:ABC-2 type transport system permease protein
MYWLIKFIIRKLRERRGAPDASDAVANRPSAQPRVHAEPSTSPATHGPLGLLLHQARYEVLINLRNPRARFFTFIFPIVLLVVFAGAFGHGHTTVDGVRVDMTRFYVPGILTMGVVVSSYASLVISVTTLRESGVLKRRHATPVPPAVLIGATALATVATTAIMSVILLLLSKIAYGVGFAAPAILAMAIIILAGTLAFSCIAYALSGLIGNPDAAQPIVQATMLPLWFLSGVFIPVVNLSSALRTIGRIFPVEHIADTLHAASVHGSFGAAFSGQDLLVLLAWIVGAGAFAAWRFSWLPSTATA